MPSPHHNLFYISITPTNGGQKWRSPGSIRSRTVWKSQPHWLVVDSLGLVEPARGEASPSGQRRGPAASGEPTVPSSNRNPSIRLQLQRPGNGNGVPPDQYHPTSWGDLIPNGRSLVDWGSCIELAYSGEDRFPSPDTFHTYVPPTTRGGKPCLRGSAPPNTVRTLQPLWLVADWLEFVKPGRGDNYPSKQRRGPAEPVEDNVSSLD